MGDDSRLKNEKSCDDTKSPISRNWLMSLSRRKKSSSGSNNSDIDGAVRTSIENDLKKREKKQKKEDKNFFQRIKRKMEMRFPPRQRKVLTSTLPDEEAASDLFCDEPKHIEQELDSNKSLTDHYRNYVAKKWLEQESGPNQVMFKACSEMISHVWYWGEISRYDAQKQLTDKPNGSFLVRDSEATGSQFTLSFRIGNCTLHYRIEHRENYWHFEELYYESIVELIEDIMLRSTDENFVCYVKVPSEMQPPFPVMLKYPISRYLKIPPLQDLCRLAIKRFIVPEQIENLPIPVKLQDYLTEKAAQIF